jgi:acid stress chaperone HdeB
MRSAAVLLAACCLAAPAKAEKIDLSTTTCQQFINSGKENITITLTWLDAYYRDEDAPPIIDTEKFVANAQKLGEYCGANPTVGLITAADKLFGE